MDRRQTLEYSPSGQFLIQVSPKTDDVNNLGAESAAFALLGSNLTRFDEELGTHIYMCPKNKRSLNLNTCHCFEKPGQFKIHKTFDLLVSFSR